MNQEENSAPIGLWQKIKRIHDSFHSGERLVFIVLGVILIISGVNSLIKINTKFSVVVPAVGGTINEGVLGSPRFINPILAISEADKSVVKLVYSGLLKPSMDGGYEGDLAENFSVSPDGLYYEVKIKDSAVFHDNKPVTADDVIFTLNKVLDPVIKSPKATNWAGVDIEKVDEKTVRFNLKKPYFPFLENLTLGILPKHLWQDVTSEEFAFSDLNLDPVGSGPYRISSVDKSDSGLPRSISLKPFKKYTLGAPYISTINLFFSQNESSALSKLSDGEITSLGGLSPASLTNIDTGSVVSTSSMPRVFGAFFNQNHAPVLANKEVREALDRAVDKKALVSEILRGFGTPLSGPTALDHWEPDGNNLEEAKKILEKAGWKANADGVLEKKGKNGPTTLTFSISTGDVPDLKRSGEVLRDTWQSLGASVDLKIFESGDLNQEVIKTRKYDVLLFGEAVGRDLDLYPFWHSSERNDPGLNISLYTNITSDKLLDEIRYSRSKEERDQKVALFKEEVEKDVPAVFLYSPDFIYIKDSEVKNVEYPELSSPSERFTNVNKWFIETKKVWSIFAPKE